MGIRLKKKRKREEIKKKEEDYELMRQNSEYIEKTNAMNRQDSKLSYTSEKTEHTAKTKTKQELEDTDDGKSQHSDNTDEEKSKNKIIKKKKTFLSCDFRCERSYFLFSQQNWLRKFCFKICITNEHDFEKVIITTIILGSIKLAASTFIDQDLA